MPSNAALMILAFLHSKTDAAQASKHDGEASPKEIPETKNQKNAVGELREECWRVRLIVLEFLHQLMRMSPLDTTAAQSGMASSPAVTALTAEARQGQKR